MVHDSHLAVFDVLFAVISDHPGVLNPGHSGFGMQFSALNCLQVLQKPLGLYQGPF